LLSILPRFQGPFETYVEPFLGGGAVFWALAEAGRLDDKLVLLGDRDQALIDVYEALRSDEDRLIRRTRDLLDGLSYDRRPQAYYMAIRTLWNCARRKRPEETLFLYHTVYNGLFRKNLAGEMNAPCRDKLKAVPTNFRRAETRLRACGAALRRLRVELLDWDFRQYEYEGSVFIGPGTAVYLDSPYLGGFVGYTRHGWTSRDAADLLALAGLWSARGAGVVLSHSKQAEFLELQARFWPTSEVHELVRVRASVSARAKGRGLRSEILVVERGSAPLPLLVLPSTSEDGGTGRDALGGDRQRGPEMSTDGGSALHASEPGTSDVDPAGL
jgi:DNA adenine methylase